VCEFEVFALTDGAMQSSGQGVTETSLEFETGEPNFELFVTGFACDDAPEDPVFVKLELLGQPGMKVESR
jgi:hypothetical protein